MKFLVPSRRFVLWGSVAGLGALALAVGGSRITCGMRSGSLVWHTREAAERLLVLSGDIFELSRIGSACCRQEGSALLSWFDTSDTLHDMLQIQCPDTRRAFLAKRVKEEFAAGDIILADRIVCARSEYLLAGCLWLLGGNVS